MPNPETYKPRNTWHVFEKAKQYKCHKIKIHVRRVKVLDVIHCKAGKIFVFIFITLFPYCQGTK